MLASPLAAELSGIPNPFRSGITRDAWDPDWVDVPEIHAGASARVREEVEQARGAGGGCGILLFGEPGSGKTHLLNRIRRWCLEQDALFSGFRLQCGPQTIWRHLRREFAGDLLHPLPDGSSQLERILAARLPGIPGGCGYALGRVLGHWREGRWRQECAAWLRGERLPESVLAALGIPADDAFEEESAEDEARRMLKELISLASPMPVVLALDQVEALQSDSQDPRGLQALGAAAAALRDETPNLVLVTCVQTSFLPVLEQQVRRADLDRMGEARLELLPLDPGQAEALLVARLDAQARLREHPRRSGQPLWPFTPYALRHLLMQGGSVTPRRLIARAKDLFEQLRGQKPQAAGALADRFLESELRRRVEQAGAAAGRAAGDELLLDGLRRLMPLAGWRSVEPRPAGCDLLVEKEGRRLALVMFNRADLRGAPQRLRRLRASCAPSQIRLLRASSLPLGSSAPRTREELDALEAEGARLVRVPPEAIAALEACRTLLADAAAGDLHQEGETLGREFVEQWLRERLPEELGGLLAQLEAGQHGTEAGVDELIEFLRQRKVVEVAEAARCLGMPEEEVRRRADQAADVVACVGDPGQVLFERCGAGG